MTRRFIWLGIATAGLIAGTAIAQFGGSRQATRDDLPAFPQAEFHLARLAYGSNGVYGGSGRYSMPMWAIDWPDAEDHILPALGRLTRIDASDPLDLAHVRLSDDEIFDYPWLFMQQAGRGGWNPTDYEAERLREYLMRGGFLVADDMHGLSDWAIFERAISRVLPGRPIVDIAEDDPLLNIIYDIDRTQIPGDRHLRYCGGGADMEGPPYWRAIYDDDGRMMVAINYNIDMGDAWEHADDPCYPVEMTNLAYRYGVNYIIYAMTH